MRRALPLTVAVSVLLVMMPRMAPAAAGGRFAGLTLGEALERLRGDGLQLVYSSELVQIDMIVAAEPEGEGAREILDSLLAPHGLGSTEGPNGILLVVPASSLENKKGAIRGTVRTVDGGEPFPGVQVSLGEAAGVTWSDPSGGFSFEGLTPGEYTVRASSAGYVESVAEGVAVRPGNVTELAFDLVPQPHYLQDVVVTPSRIGFLHPEPEAHQFLDRREVQQLPHLSDDVFRIFPWLPGTTAGDISSEFGVRGGAKDEVMFLLDGMQVHDPYHLRDFFSLFSVVDSEIIGGVDVLSGGFPAEYGDRMSGVVDLAIAVPERSGWSLGVTGMHARVQAQGVQEDGRGSWLVSARRGYLDWLMEWLARIDEEPSISGTPQYWDAYASVRRQLGEKNLLSAHLLTSHDDIEAVDEVELETSQGSSASWYLWATLHSSFGGGLSARTVASLTDVERRREGSSLPGAVSVTAARDSRSFTIVGLDQDWVLEPSRGHLLKLGLDVRRVEASYDVDSTFIVRDPLFTGFGPPQRIRRQANVTPHGWQVGVYSADRVRLAPGVTAEVGVRWDHESWTPGDDQVSPRLNLVWETADLGTVRASWGSFAQSQAIYELQVDDGIDTFFPAQWADHAVVAWERAMASGVAIRVEAYRKVMTDLRPRFENLFESLDLFPEGEPDRVEIAPDRAESRGVEVLLKGAAGPHFGWWVGGALSAAEDRIDGEWVPRSWDQRRTFSFSLSWMPGSKWSANVAGLYHSGWPVTHGEVSWVEGPDGSWEYVSEVGERNATRVPDYRRIDLRISRMIPLGSGTARIFFEAMNLFDHTNVRCDTEINFARTPDGSLTIAEGDQNWFPAFLSLGFVVSF